MRRETIKSAIQRQLIRSDFGRIRWNNFITLMFHKSIQLEQAEDLIDRWDWKVNRAMVGPRFTKGKNRNRRQVFFGCCGKDTSGNLHTHLNVKIPTDWIQERFEDCSRSSFRQLVDNGTVHFSKNDKGYFDGTDNQGTVNYTTKFGHLGTDERGAIDTSSIVISRNIEIVL